MENTPGVTRTRDILLRRQMLYPAELRGLGTYIPHFCPKSQTLPKTGTLQHARPRPCSGSRILWAIGHRVMDITPAMCPSADLSLDT